MEHKHNTLWDFSSVECATDSYIPTIMKHKFMFHQSDETITAEKHLLLSDISHLNVADVLSKYLGAHPVTGDNDKNYVVTGSLDGHEVLIYITQGSKSRHAPSAYDHDDNDIITGIRINRVKIEILSHRNIIKNIFAFLASTFKEAKISSIRWWFKGDHGPSNREMFLEPLTTKLHHEFYPTLNKHPSLFLEEYLKSDNSILLLHGPAGVGKTTLLRHLICDFNLIADIIYDESIMKQDNVFQDFLFGKSQIMIIEDADRILHSREDGDNDMMSRFLNVSDGIIKLPEKKLVFTTNITDFGKVDSALTRPGRCFAIVNTRELTYVEACAAAKAAKIEIPQIVKDYTLAELFNKKANTAPRRPGF